MTSEGSGESAKQAEPLLAQPGLIQEEKQCLRLNAREVEIAGIAQSFLRMSISL
jgi:hypothetical protein